MLWSHYNIIIIVKKKNKGRKDKENRQHSEKMHERNKGKEGGKLSDHQREWVSYLKDAL